MELLTAQIRNATRFAAFAATLAVAVVSTRADTFVWNGTGVSGGVANVLLDNPSVLTTWSNSGGPTTMNPGPTDIASISLTSAASLSQTTASLLGYAELFMTATAKSTLTFNGTNTFNDFTANAQTTVKILSGMTTITGGATIGATSFLQLNGLTHIFNADGGLTVRSGGSTDFGASGGKIVAPVFTNLGFLNSFNTSSVGPIIDAALHNGVSGSLQFRMDTGTGLTDARTLVIEDGVTNAGVIFSWFNRVSGSTGTNIRGLTITVNNGDFVNLAGSTVTFRNNATTGTAADIVNVGLNVLNGNLTNAGVFHVANYTAIISGGKTINQNLLVSGAFTNSGLMSITAIGASGTNTTTLSVGNFVHNSGSILINNGAGNTSRTTLIAGSLLTNAGFIQNRDTTSSPVTITGTVFNAAAGSLDFTLLGVGAARARFFNVNGGFTNEGLVFASVQNTDTTVNILDRGATLDFLGSVKNRSGATLTLFNSHTGIAIQTNHLGVRVRGGNLDSDGAINITATDTSASARRAERTTLWVSGVFTNAGVMSLSSQGASGYAAKILASQITNSGNIYIDKPLGTSAHPVVFGNSAGGNVTFTNEVGGKLTVRDSKSALYFSTATLTNKGNMTISANAKVAMGAAVQTGVISFESGEIQMQTNTGLINNGQIVKTTSGVGAISHGNGLAANNGVINVNGGTLIINHINTVTGLWHMDSNWNDSSGNGLNGTRFGTGPQFSTTNQKVGSAAGSFNGANSDYVSVAHNDLLNMGPNFAVAAWFNVSTISPGTVDGSPDNRQATILSKGRDLNAGTYRLFYDRVSNVFGFGVTFANDPVPRFGQSVASSAVGILNQWHHIVGQWTNNTLYLYVNGVLTASTSFPDLYVGANEFALEFGKLSQYTYHLTGMVDEAAIFQRALTPSEISAMYNAGAGVALSHDYLRSIAPKSSFTNNAAGSINVTGAVADLTNAPLTNVGTMNVTSNGVLLLGTVTSQTGTMTATNSRIIVAQNWTNDGYIKITHSEIRTGEGAGLFTNAFYISTGSSINSNFHNTGTFSLTGHTSITGNFTNAGWSDVGSFNLTVQGSINANSGTGITTGVLKGSGTYTIAPSGGVATFTNNITSATGLGGNYDTTSMTFNMASGTINFEVLSTDMGSAAFSQLGNGFAMGTLTLPNTLSLLRLLDNSINQGGGTQEAIYVENLHLGSALTASNFDFSTNGLKIYYNHIIGDGGANFIGTYDGPARIVYFGHIIPLNLPPPPSGVIPEPSTLALLLLGLPLLYVVWRRQGGKSDVKRV